MTENNSDSEPEKASLPRPGSLGVTRVRHDAKIRLLTIERIERPAPWMVRMVLTGPDLAGFVSLGFDDHVKLFVPAPGADRPVLPTMGPNGLTFPNGSERPLMRDFTPRKFDAARGELTLEFALHEKGPATAWASQAAPGDQLGIGGPRGSMIIPVDVFKHHILIGDETALPAIARRLEELPAGSRAQVIAEVEGRGDEIELASAADLTVTWAYRAAATARPLPQTVASTPIDKADAYAWVACESALAKTLRAHLIDERGFDPAWIKAAGYWRRGAAAVHDVHGDG